MEKNPDKKLEGEVLPQRTADRSNPVDSNWGKGGSYKRNPQTGARTLIGRTKVCVNCTVGTKK